jgi:prepilin-type N-terminal cleavage/methylation domain-containing protein
MDMNFSSGEDGSRIAQSTVGMRFNSRRDTGFTLFEMLITTAVVAIIAGMAVPLLNDVAGGMKLGDATRGVERELQTARLTAVSSNQPMRLRFDCPSAGNYRMTELIGTPKVPAAGDGAVDRCLLASYPYPGDTDKSPLSRPNRDGPLRTLDPSVTFTQTTTIEFWPDGSAHTNTGGTNPWPPIAGTGYTIILTRKGVTKSIVVNGVGKIQIK